jgi:peptide/nickel transport system permease protein
VSLLGTDQIGRDLLTRILFGGRVSLLIACSAVAVAAFSGTVLGLVAGYAGGAIDNVIMRIADIQLAFPAILLALAVTAAIGASIPNLIITLGITRWVSYARLIRGGALSAREEDFVLSATAIGARPPRILFKHVLPNVVSPVIILATLHIGQMIIYESSLSFLGLGIQPPTPSWGGMVSSGREYLNTSWWISTFPGFAIAATVLLSGLVGDAVRDALDPTFREY